MKESKKMFEEDTNQKFSVMKTRSEGLKLGSKDISVAKSAYLVEAAF